MENSNKIVPPHLNAEIYRTDTTGTTTLTDLDYIRICSDGKVLIGASELTGRYWNGGAYLYNKLDDTKTIGPDSKVTISLTSGTADGCFIESSNKVLLCEDSGTVSIWTRGDQQNAWNQWTEHASVAEHDDIVLVVDCLVPELHYVTVGGDGHAKIWDINDMICVRNYFKAHTSMIYGLSVKPNSTTCFATGSLDQDLTLWDENVDKPVLDLFNNDCGIRCIAWIDEHRLLAGDEAGVLRVIDVRNTENYIRIAEFPAAVHKLAMHPDGDKVAVCCDNKIVTVCNVTENSKRIELYHDRHRHNNFVRGLAWDIEDNKTLHTVGWNAEVRSHQIFWD